MTLSRMLLASLLIAPLAHTPAQAEPVPVRFIQGATHGFLVIRTTEGKIIATGDSVTVAHPDRVVSHTTFHFRDGSLDDETTTFTQQGFFKLVSDHHIQRGPSFPQPMDMLVEGSGDVTLRMQDKNGKETVKQEHMDLPADIANGLVIVLLQNIKSDSPENKLSMVVPVQGKPRLVKLAVTPVGQASFRMAGIARKGIDFLARIELGGIVGVIAPVIGKQPADIHATILDDGAPAFIQEQGQLFGDGPIWRIEQVSATFPAKRASK